jgi:hypothetical protein
MASASNYLQNNAKRTALLQGYLKIESIVLLVIALVMTVLCWLDLFVVPWMWPIWLIGGIVGATAVAMSNTRDKRKINKAREQIVEREINADDLHISELQAGVSRALYQHKSIQKMITARTEDFGRLSSHMDEWLRRVHQLAGGLDTVLRHPRVLEHFYTVMDTNEVKDANFDSIAGLDNATAVVTAQHGDHQRYDEGYNKLILARDAVAQARNGLNATIDHVVSVNEVLRHTRQHTLSEQHLDQMNTMLLGELDALTETQRVVNKLAAAYDIRLA